MMQELLAGCTRLIDMPVANDEVREEEPRMHEA